MNKKLSKKDLKAWKDFVEGNQSVPDKDNFKNAAKELGVPEEMVGLPIFKKARKVLHDMRDNLDNLL